MGPRDNGIEMYSVSAAYTETISLLTFIETTFLGSNLSQEGEERSSKILEER